jgi:uncharacterized protein YeeX (DUF496 family)
MGSTKANQIQRLTEERDRLRREFGPLQAELQETKRKLREERWRVAELACPLQDFVRWGRLERPSTMINEAGRMADLVDIFDDAVSALTGAESLTEERDND